MLWFENIQSSTFRGSEYTEAKWHIPHFQLWTIFMAFSSWSSHLTAHFYKGLKSKLLQTSLNFKGPFYSKDASTSKVAFSKTLVNTDWTEVKPLCSLPKNLRGKQTIEITNYFVQQCLNKPILHTRKSSNIFHTLKDTDTYLVSIAGGKPIQMEGIWSLWSLTVRCTYFCIRSYYTGAGLLKKLKQQPSFIS